MKRNVKWPALILTLAIILAFLAGCTPNNGTINSNIKATDSTEITNSTECANTYEAISPYLDYVGNPHPDEDKAITLTKEEYDNIDNIMFMGMKGEMSFQIRDGYISSCTWTSFSYYSEEEYQAIAEDLHIYFGTYPDTKKESYGNGNTYRYYWTDPYYGFAVTMAHGFFRYDPEGDIELKWEISEEACDILGHTWIDATCVNPKTCHVCGATEGKATGHQGSELSEWDIDYNKAIRVEEYRCTMCEEIIELQSESITTFVNGDHFTIYPHGFAKRFEESSTRLNNIDYATPVKYAYNSVIFDEENYVYYRIQDKNDDWTDIGIMSFTAPNGKTISAIDDFSENSFSSINILIEDASDVSAIVYTALLAIDPGLGYDEAAIVGQAIVDDLQDLRLVDDNYVDSIDKNSISYALCKDRDYYYFLISVETK